MTSCVHQSLSDLMDISDRVLYGGSISTHLIFLTGSFSLSGLHLINVPTIYDLEFGLWTMFLLLFIA